jgi:hypothetical protein
MRKLTRLWQGIESVPGLAAIPAYWEHFCGTEFPLIRPHLRPTEDIGATYPCPHPRDHDCPRRIVQYGDGTLAAICRHPHKLCDDVPLAPKDALVCTLDIGALVRPIVEGLCVRTQNLQVRAHGVWELGLSTSRATRNHPVFLLVFARRDDFRSALRELALSCTTPFVAVAPTSNHLTVELRETLARRHSDFISMEERVGLSEDGRFVALEITDADEITPTPVEQRHAVVEKYKSDFNCTDQVIFEDAGVHKSDFYKWMKGTLGNKSSKSKRIEGILRTDPKLRTRR